MIVKQERFEQERTIHSTRHDAGVRAMHQWLIGRRDELNHRWPTTAGDELLTMQGEAKAVAKLLAVIETGPKTKSTEGGE